MNKYQIMKSLQNKKPLALLGILLLAIIGYNTQNIGEVGVQAITPSEQVADVGFIPGTQATGDVVLSLFRARIDINQSATLNISSATVTLYNSSIDVVNATTAITSFPSTVTLYLPASEVGKSETYHMNVSATGKVGAVTTTYIATSGEYNNRPQYNSNVKQYGGITDINSPSVREALAYKALYHPRQQIVDVAVVSATNISLIIGG